MMSPILKSKEQRDLFLLVVMVALTGIFLLYILLPDGESTVREAKGHFLFQGKPPVAGESVSPDSGFSGKLSELLDQAFRALQEEEITGLTPGVRELETHMDKVGALARTKGGREALRSWLLDSRRIGLFELGDPKILNIPAFVSKEVRFHLYLALLYLRYRTPEGLSQLRSASEFRLLQLLDAPIFEIVNWELKQDAEALPVLMVFRIWLEGRDLYPQSSPGTEFSRRLNRFRDMGSGRWVSRIMRLIDFSTEIREFTIQWTEDDGFLGNDQGVFRELRLPVHQYLGQRYTGLPIRGNGNNDWLFRLAESDSGEIELLDFRIMSPELPGPALEPRYVLYHPRGSRFLVIYSPFQPEPEPSDPLCNIVGRQRDIQHCADRRLLLVPSDVEDEKVRMEELKHFGRFLKRLGSS